MGFAEELLFRGWLWGELEQHLGRGRALWGQALVFSLVHTRFNLGPAGAVGLLGGLTLLGLALALQRRADAGVLWGAVGLHGGLVGGWFLLQGGLLTLAPEAPAWMVGPGGCPSEPHRRGGGMAGAGYAAVGAAAVVGSGRQIGGRKRSFRGMKKKRARRGRCLADFNPIRAS